MIFTFGTTGMQCTQQHCIAGGSTQVAICMPILYNTYCSASCLHIGWPIMCSFMLAISCKEMIVRLEPLIGLPVIMYLLDYSN